MEVDVGSTILLMDSGSADESNKGLRYTFWAQFWWKPRRKKAGTRKITSLMLIKSGT